jgi:hypothetical protein
VKRPLALALALALALLAAFAALLLRAPPLPRPASPPPTASIPTTPGRGALLWVRPRDASPGAAEVSLWLDADGRELRREPGIFLHAREKTLQLRMVSQNTPMPPCPRGNTPFPVRTVQRATLTDERGGEVEALAAAEPGGALVEEHHRPLAGLGELLFFRTERVENPCDERPRYGAEFRVVRVGAGGAEQPGEPARVEVAGGLREEAAARMNARLGAGIRGEALRVTMVVPEFGAEGGRWMTQLTARVPWELSSGGWGSETASERLPGAAPWIGRGLRVPAVALRYAREHPGEEVAGASETP